MKITLHLNEDKLKNDILIHRNVDRVSASILSMQIAEFFYEIS
jgi:hypothetical protein